MFVFLAEDDPKRHFRAPKHHVIISLRREIYENSIPLPFPQSSWSSALSDSDAERDVVIMKSAGSAFS